MRHHRGVTSALPLILNRLFSGVHCACIPDVPSRFLSDPAVLEHPAVVTAFREVERNLSALYINTTRDGLSFAVVSFVM